MKKIAKELRKILHNIKIILVPPLPPETMEQSIDRYRSYGITIGENCNIYTPLGNGRDSSLLSFGNNVTVSFNVIFLTHDNAVIKTTHGAYTDVLGRISVGDNVFIGAGSIILPGVTIADNCIIGAGSVVVKSTYSGGVYAGNPAVYICSVEDYSLKNSKHMVNLNGKSKEQVEAMIKNNPSLLKQR